MHKIKRAIYTFIALRLSDDDTKNLKKIFKIFDDDNNGKISLSEMKDAFIRLNIKDYENEIENIFNSIDTDKSGMIDYTEFLSASINGNNEILSKKTLKDTFKLLDNDNSGKISKNNIMNVLKLENLNEKIIDNYINKYDLNKDGEIDYNEFLNVMENYLGKEEKKDNKEEKINKTKEIKENEEKNKK
jgi:calcium-dependent protein kinase